MKSILFIINSLTIGGSEKSLISLLGFIDYSKYKVDLLMLKKGEAFDKFIPNEVNILEVPEYYKYLQGNLRNIKIKNRFKYRFIRYKCSLDLRLNGRKGKIRNNQQIFYENQKNILEKINKNYDIAISYAQGFPTYLLADKINANKKIAWINCDYSATMYDKDLDKYYYDKVDKIIAVSESGKKSIIRVNKEYENKIEVIKDIVNPDLIIKMSEDSINEINNLEFNIVTVARLVEGYKGYDIAVEACKILKDKGYKFKWYAIGEGHDREKIENRIKHNNLEKEFILLGSKDNPYPYMKKCNLYVQTSRKEGFGLTVVEAKILKKPIVCTNFATAKEIINNNIDGLIVKTDVKSLSEGIIKMIEDKEFYNNISKELMDKKVYSSINQINKFYNVINN